MTLLEYARQTNRSPNWVIWFAMAVMTIAVKLVISAIGWLLT
jgi:hypothetical protein